MRRTQNATTTQTTLPLTKESSKASEQQRENNFLMHLLRSTPFIKQRLIHEQKMWDRIASSTLIHINWDEDGICGGDLSSRNTLKECHFLEREHSGSAVLRDKNGVVFTYTPQPEPLMSKTFYYCRGLYYNFRNRF